MFPTNPITEDRQPVPGSAGRTFRVVTFPTNPIAEDRQPVEFKQIGYVLNSLFPTNPIAGRSATSAPAASRSRVTNIGFPTNPIAEDRQRATVNTGGNRTEVEFPTNPMPSAHVCVTAEDRQPSP